MIVDPAESIQFFIKCGKKCIFRYYSKSVSSVDLRKKGSRETVSSNGSTDLSSPAASNHFPTVMFTKYSGKLRVLSQHVLQQCVADAEETVKVYGYVSSFGKNQVRAQLTKILADSRDRLLVPVGSSGTGLATLKSDMDFTLLTSLDKKRRDLISHRFHDQIFRKDFMSRYMRAIASSHFGKNNIDWKMSQSLWNAHVPLLSIRTYSGLEIDISFDSEEGIRNTYYVRHCVLQDSRVRLLNMWAQNWLSALKLKDSRGGLFSSYHILSLVLHFLQYRNYKFLDPLLPVVYENSSDELSKLIPVERIAKDLMEPVKLPRVAANTSPDVSELVIHFINHYSSLDFREVIMNLADASISRRNGSCCDDDSLQIIDPYSKGTVCHVRMGAELMNRAFRSTREMMLKDKGLKWPVDLNRL
ncbi:hypothetical protein AB6A40_005679 [Gnathostoma spinigerum]|uniref:Poly(A) RNA polymerase mitochondrial-like central palm domain-containing protein n=1 Tax=Gnathostoma spinigerum TaxID=75299 RepID=A0ABD6EHA5_9BILA